METLDRDLTAEEFVPGPPDGAHTALAYPLDQAISPGDQSSLVHRRRLRHRTPLRKPVRIPGATIVNGGRGQAAARCASAMLSIRGRASAGHMRTCEGFGTPGASGT
ncbi:UmuC protein [Streptomyces sp. NBRC 110611]|nr:UmuC protein [Streptomyces sp. NBRC 110611]